MMGRGGGVGKGVGGCPFGGGGVGGSEGILEKRGCILARHLFRERSSLTMLQIEDTDVITRRFREAFHDFSELD